MTELTANRTLVKSPPELWAECSDAASLARHLGQFGEIRITRLEPETAVAWEGEHASGTVRLEPSGWGTRVVLTARLGPPDPEPADPPPRRPLWTRLLEALGWRERAPEPPPASEEPAEPGALTAALDSLGQAHHRPFSRA
jgi:hypothetical protein